MIHDDTLPKKENITHYRKQAVDEHNVTFICNDNTTVVIYYIN